MLFYKPYLERLGITVNIRTVDSVQYQNRLRSFDFDITTAVWGQSLSPGNEQRDFFGSEAADRPGSRNLPGIKNPAVDALIERIIFAKDRAELVARCKALDRVLLWNCYVVPQFAAGFRACRALGPLQPSRAVAEIRRFGFPGAVVVGRRKGSQDRKAQLKDIRAWRTLNPPARARSRRRRVERRAAAAGHGRSEAGAEAMACRCSAT